jgi:hypothetical protein
MNREHRLQYCKICKNQKMDLKNGLVCGLTNERATFDVECSNFIKDNFLVKKEKEKILRRIENPDSEESGGVSVWSVVVIILIILRIIMRLAK